MMFGDLINILDATTGPDRSVDRQIAFAVRFRPAKGTMARQSFDEHEAKHGYETSWIAHAPFRTWWDIPLYTGSMNDVIALITEKLPGWAWKVGTCSVSDDAWLVPDFNDPVRGERLRTEFGADTMQAGSIWDTGVDIDLRPAGRPVIALLIAFFTALEAMEKKNDPA